LGKELLRASLPGTLGEILADVNRKFTEDVEYYGQDTFRELAGAGAR
jgi:hypothetical protein